MRLIEKYCCTGLFQHCNRIPSVWFISPGYHKVILGGTAIIAPGGRG